MSAPQRIFLDVSYTRTQVGNVGITRTVRRLLDTLTAMGGEGGWVCRAVAFHSKGFRLARDRSSAHAAAASSRREARLLRWAAQGRVRRAVSALVPLPLLHRVWALYNRLAFDGLSKDEADVDFRAGDWLVIGDQAWNYRSWEAAALARDQGVKVILIIYDLIPLREPQFCNPLFTRVFDHWLARMLEQTDAVLCISKATEQDLREYCVRANRRLPPAVHFRLGGDKLDAGADQEVRPAVRTFLARESACFAAVGSFEPRKNYGFLLDAFEQLWRDGHDLQLIVLGRPNEESRPLLERFRLHPEANKRLLCLFDASDAEILFVYAQCRALVFPTLAEGFGLPLVEARMQGCRVIASDLPALAELADEGVSLFPANSQAAFCALVLREAAATPGIPVGRMAHFGWSESALQFMSRSRALLDQT